MKSKRNTFVSILVIAIYVITVAFTAVSLSVEYKNGNNRVNRKFTAIERSLSLYLRNNEFTAESFYSKIENIIGDKQDISRLQISYSGMPIYTYPMDLNAAQGAAPKLMRQMQTSIAAKDGTEIILAAEMYLLKPQSIFSRCRLAFIIILATTLLLILYNVFFAENTKESETTKEYKESEDTVSEEEIDLTIEDQAFNEDFGDKAFNITQEEASALLAPQEKTEYEDDVPDFEMEPAEDKVELQEQTEQPEPIAKETSEQTVFCPQESMQQRIDNELIRAASSDQDLALFTIRIAGLDWNTPAGKELSQMLLNEAKFDDSIFNYETDGCVLIFQNLNTDSSLLAAEKIKDKIKDILEKHGMNNKFGIGISTRSLRLLSFSRLFEESSKALEHALEDQDSPIVAFRVNPEKYRNYLASSSGASAS